MPQRRLPFLSLRLYKYLPPSSSIYLSCSLFLPLSLTHSGSRHRRRIATAARSVLLFLSFRRRYPTCAASGNAVHYIPGVLSYLPVLLAAVAVARSGALLRTFEKTSLPRFFILNRGTPPPVALSAVSPR